jgi:hypothetical protein
MTRVLMTALGLYSLLPHPKFERRTIMSGCESPLSFWSKLGLRARPARERNRMLNRWIPYLENINSS